MSRTIAQHKSAKTAERANAEPTEHETAGWMQKNSNQASKNLPKEFCDKHMPISDQAFSLEAESGQVYRVSYAVRLHQLGGGWKKFSVDQKLVPGDVLVFQLASPARFKVCIVRKKDSNQAIGVGRGFVKPYTFNPVSEVIDLEEEEEEENSDTNRLIMEKYHDAEIRNGVCYDFKLVKSIEDFSIVANGLVIDGELPGWVRSRYYELCRSQNSFLHRGVIKDLTCKLIAGAIAETVNIADAIRGFRGDVSGEGDFETWRTKLEAFEKLGMKVDFLLVRLRKLEEVWDEANRYMELRTQRAAAEAEVRNLEAQLGEAKGRVGELNTVIGLDGYRRCFQRFGKWSMVTSSVSEDVKEEC
ncbi:unnamed protein product [Linum tenue]|uniref:TF-B3 domain-containing protein n=1 Tax=Linum tenue TaxID=586396 RepID=A0AAV0MLH8_9ROSI|nr:unnamed protein product [Linum tenue]